MYALTFCAQHLRSCGYQQKKERYFAQYNVDGDHKGIKIAALLSPEKVLTKPCNKEPATAYPTATKVG